MDQQGSPCYGSLKWLSESYDIKVNFVGQLDAKKLVASVLLYVFNVGFPASLLPKKKSSFSLKIFQIAWFIKNLRLSEVGDYK